MTLDSNHASAPDFSGMRLFGGRIRLSTRLGAGAFGAVYRAKQFFRETYVREVAVKITHRRGLQESEIPELLNEAILLARVNAQCDDADAKKHFIQVYEFGLLQECNARGYLVMEYVLGTPLHSHLQSAGPSLPMTTARRYLRQICKAIGACHRLPEPITHGDLKPDNILVDNLQTARIADFGLASPVNRLTGVAPDPGGCLAYCAPETLTGSRYPESDIYAIGLIMYEALTGAAPHLKMPPADNPLDSSAHYYRMKRNLCFPPIEQLSKALRPDVKLFRIVERCCQFHHMDRFQSIEELTRELDENEPREDDTEETKDGGTDDCALAPVLERIDAEMQLKRHEAAVAYIETLVEAEHPEIQARLAICFVRGGRSREGYDFGATLLESAGLALATRRRLLQAMLDAMRDLVGQDGAQWEPHVQYYQDQLARLNDG